MEPGRICTVFIITKLQNSFLVRLWTKPSFPSYILVESQRVLQEM